MKGASRHHGRHIGCSQAPTCGSVAFSSGRSFPLVSMVKSADARQRNQFRAGRLWLHRAAARSILAQPIVSAVRVVVGHVLAGETADVRFVQRDHVIETIPARASNPAFPGAVLPRTAHARSRRLYAGRLQEVEHLPAELSVAVQDDVAVTGGVRKRLSKLLNHPIGRWVRSHVEVQDLAPSVIDREEAVRAGGR